MWKKFTQGAQFCPSCGTPAPTELNQETGVHTLNKRKALCIGGAALAVTIVAVVGFTRHKNTAGGDGRAPDSGMQSSKQDSAEQDSNTVTDQNSKDKNPDVDISKEFDSKNYKKMGMSRKQIKDLKQAYENAYDDESKGLNDYILAYAAHYGDPTYYEFDVSALVGITENLYQTVNKYAPGLKDQIAADIAGHANSHVGRFLLEEGVNAVLSDSDYGQELRSGLEQLALGALKCGTEFIADLPEGDKQTTRSDSACPMAVCRDYALVCSYGTIGQMLDELAFNSGYTMAKEALTKHQDAIQKGYEQIPLSEYYSEDLNVVYEAYLKKENLRGRSQVLQEKMQEWDENMLKCRSDLLNQLKLEGPLDDPNLKVVRDPEHTKL